MSSPIDPSAPANAAVTRLYEEGARAWPGFRVAPEAFRVSLLARIGEPEESSPEALHAGDLYLAIACEHGVGPALEAFDRMLNAELPRMLGGLAAKVNADEIRQLLGEKLFVAGPAGKRISRYTGKGELAGFVRVAATRLALDLIRTEHEEPASDAAILERSGASQDPELQLLKKKYARELADAFPAALAALEVEDRNLLRYHYLDGLTIDALAPLLGVHRASAARYLNRAREALRAALLSELEERLRVTPSELESIVRLAQSELHISFGRMFQTPKPSGS